MNLLINTCPNLYFTNVDSLICELNSESFEADSSPSKVLGVALAALVTIGSLGKYYGNKYFSNQENFLSAVIQNSKWKVKLFLAANSININHQDIDGETALTIAVGLGRAEIVQVLIAAGADVNLANNNGRTALMYAVRFGRIEIVQALIAAGADINLQDNEGRAALMCAASLDRIEIVQALIAAGANVNLANNIGKTALMLSAEEEGYNRYTALMPAASLDR